MRNVQKQTRLSVLVLDVFLRSVSFAPTSKRHSIGGGATEIFILTNSVCHSLVCAMCNV